MSTLDSLIRLNRWQLDEQRRCVAELEQLAVKLRAELARLEQEQAAEQAAAQRSPEAAYGYGAYAETVIERRRKLTQSLADTDQKMAKARDALSEAFQEVKRYEIAAARRVLAQRTEQERLQQRDTDEQAGNLYRRFQGK